jgi:hypothetical protein
MLYKQDATLRTEFTQHIWGSSGGFFERVNRSELHNTEEFT